jgi:TPR repeat protein
MRSARNAGGVVLGLAAILLLGCERPPTEPADPQRAVALKEKAVRTAWKACRAGGQADCARLEAILADDTGFKARVGTDARILSQVCELGDPDRCLDLGLKLFFGVGVPRDPAAADAAMARARLE